MFRNGLIRTLMDQNQFGNGFRDLKPTWDNTASSNKLSPWSSPSSLSTDLNDIRPKTGLLTKHDFSFPNGRGTMIQYSNSWGTSNDHFPLLNTKFNPMSDYVNRNNQFLDLRSKLMNQIQNSLNSYLLEIQGNKYDKNNGPTINEKPNGLIDYADNKMGLETNKQQQQQQQQHHSEEEVEQVEQQQQQYKPISYSNNSASKGLSKDQINDIRKQVLEQSNVYRQKHGLPIFTIDDEVSE